MEATPSVNAADSRWAVGVSRLATDEGAGSGRLSDSRWWRSGRVHARRMTLLGLTLAALTLALAGCASSEQSTEEQRALQAQLEELRAIQARPWGVTVPGYAAAVATGDGSAPGVVGAVSGSAAPPGSQAMRPADRFHVGSVTKTFTAALILQLDQSGELSIDDPVSRWIDFPGGDEVTIAMLLGHTSGIPDFTQFDYRRNSTPEQSIALVAGRPFEFAPGAAWAYSNTNYTMLGLIAERATSRTWADLVDSRFFQPLGLDDTYVWTGAPEGPTVNGARLACGESSEPACAPPQSGLAILPVDDGYDWTVAWSAGAVVSTPADIARWMLALVGGDVLDASHRRLLTTPTPQSVASDFGEAVASLGAISGGGTLRWVGNGLGLFQYEIDGVGTAWGHEGTINGFVANAAYVASTGQGIAVTSNFAESDSFSALGAVAVTASGWSGKAP
jgi:D-alanyl-D-alanine carboxypeptidase